MAGRLRPLHDRLIVRRLDGHGRETVTPGGIVIPATVERGIQTKRDYFRAEVLAMGPEAIRKTRWYRGESDCTDCLSMTHCEIHNKVEGTYPADWCPPKPGERTGDLEVGDDVLVMTYADEPDKIYTGERTAYGRAVRLDDVLCVVES